MTSFYYGGGGADFLVLRHMTCRSAVTVATKSACHTLRCYPIRINWFSYLFRLLAD